MNKLLSILLILTLNVNLIKSQDTNYDGSVNLVEGDLDVYVGEELILMFDTTFYHNNKWGQNFDGPPFLKNYKKSNTKKSNIYFPFKEYTHGEWKTNYNSLVGKHFKVLSIKEEQKRDKVEKYFELLLKETDEILFIATKKPFSLRNDVFFPFFVVKHLEYLKQIFINKKFVGVGFDRDLHPDRGTTKHFVNKISDLTMPWKDTWICKDIKLDMKKNPLILVLTNNKQDIDLPMRKHGVYRFFFEKKHISFCDVDCYGKNFVYNVYDYAPEPPLCHELESPLDCYQDKIKKWVSDFKKQKDYPNFNFNDFEIVGFSNSLELKDNNNNKTYIDEYILKKFLKSEYQENEVGKLIELVQEKSFNLAQEKNKVMEIFNIYPSFPNSASGVSFSIDWFYYNTKKEIKYIYFTVVPYNAVGDRQYCDIRDHATFTGSATGPISASSRPKEYNWENAWYNSTIDSLEIIKVKLEYMDGTSYTFVKELKKIISPYFNK